MSYTYLQEEGEESLADCFSDIALCALSKSRNTAEKPCCNASGTDCCHASQSGMMSQPSMAGRGEESRKSSAAASRAKTSAKQEQPQAERESTESEAASGEKWQGSLARWDRNTSSWKTPQSSLLEGLDEFSETWPQWGMMQGGDASPLPTLAPPISETGFGYLPTPDASLGLFDAAASMDLVSCFNKETVGHRPSGAKIGSSLRWHPEFIFEWQRTGGELNAEWTEALMGWPIGWTGLQPLETDRFRRWQQQYGDFSKGAA
jgi:hypothetical protein